MLHKIKRLSYHGTRSRKPCKHAMPQGEIGDDGCADVWLIDINDTLTIFNLAANVRNKLIVEKDGTIIIYDDHYE